MTEDKNRLSYRVMHNTNAKREVSKRITKFRVVHRKTPLVSYTPAFKISINDKAFEQLLTRNIVHGIICMVKRGSKPYKFVRVREPVVRFLLKRSGLDSEFRIGCLKVADRIFAQVEAKP